MVLGLTGCLSDGEVQEVLGDRDLDHWRDCGDRPSTADDPCDCADADPDRNPDKVEVCNSQDDDCNGGVDDGLQFLTYYADRDGDGSGDTGAPVSSCQALTGYVLSDGDCDDTNSRVYPGAAEVCNGQDDDCDGTADDALTFQTYYEDKDGDSYGDTATSALACENATGYVLLPGDCDDADAATHPTAPETCDGLDNDCDGENDEGLTFSEWYLDVDGDGYGASAQASETGGTPAPAAYLYCAQPVGYVANDLDCDDTDDAFHPYADESCGEVDEPDYNCDGSTGYEDLDRDGAPACSENDQQGDCDDADPLAWPGRAEVCDGIDNDCNGEVDDDVGEHTWFPDADGDGYGNEADPDVFTGCNVAGWSLIAGDCNDLNSEAHPGAAEVCNGLDDDCDGQSDEGLLTTAWYPDLDQDGYGDEDATPIVQCQQPPGTVSDGKDCNDDPLEGGVSIHPGAQEVCGEDTDYNCDGLTGDEDNDGDGWQGCEDCDDADSSTYPDASEQCDGKDNDCDGEVDNPGSQVWYRDADGDGYGLTTETKLLVGCVTSGWALEPGDCDDTNAERNPGEVERCDGIDNNCDGATNADELDDDGDGVLRCTSATLPADCDDADPDRSPVAVEHCDGTDNDCDNLVDEENGATWYADVDGDGYGDASLTRVECGQPAGYVSNGDDCNDSRADIHPDAVEVCDLYDTDEDCDGKVDDADTFSDYSSHTLYYRDQDDDGFGDATDQGTRYCDDPSTDVIRYVTNNRDCNDSSGSYHPGAVETLCDDDYNCDGVTGKRDLDGDGAYACGTDNDCDDLDEDVHPGALEVCDPSDTDEDCNGVADNGDPGAADDGRLDFYPDGDRDGYGDAGLQPTRYCDDPSTPEQIWSGNRADCDDSDNDVHPGLPERCTTAFDDDCDGLVNDGTAADAQHYYRDADLDTFGSPSDSQAACTLLDGYVERAGDCDDAASAINPDGLEICDPESADEDCDGSADDDDLSVDLATGVAVYPDLDQDGHAAPSATGTLACHGSPGLSPLADDCDDSDPEISPETGPACVAPPTCPADDSEPDLDGDGYSTACDCRDDDPAVNPGAQEVCDTHGTDENCNGLANDEDGLIDTDDQTVGWPDADGDGYGDASAASALHCPATSADAGEWVDNAEDCQDQDPLAYPGAPERCNTGYDDNCNDQINEGDGVDQTYYRDADGDSYGDSATPLVACGQPDGYVLTAGDCDDADAGRSPGATEVCDDLDNDCDRSVDEGVSEVYYQDDDGDGYGATETAQSGCTVPAGTVLEGNDCDDTDSTISPAVPEIQDDDLDNNCDGLTDVDLYVSEDGNYPNGDAEAYTSIQAAIDSTEDGDVIGVGPGSYFESIDFKGKAITVIGIEGADATFLYGRSETSVVVFASGETSAAVLEGLTISGGDGYDSTCNEASTSYTYGGGICIKDAAPTLRGLEIGGNTAYYGGGLAIFGAASPLLEDVSVRNNIASSRGGGIYLGGGRVTVIGGDVTYNTAGNQGGGIYAGADLLTIEDTVVTSNTAGNNGGGIYCSDNPLHATAVTVTNNAADYGGGVYLDGDSGHLLQDCLLEENSASNGGGAYFNSATVTVSGTDLETRTEIRQNVANGNGGGLYSSNSNVTLAFARLAANRATTNGGGMYLSSGSVLAADLEVDDNDAGSNGGGLFTYSGTAANITRLALRNNTAASSGGGAYASNTGTWWNILVAGNTARSGGGGLYVSSRLVLSQATVVGNRTQSYGGGLYLNYSSATLSQSIVAFNRSTTGDNLYTYGGSPSVWDSVVFNPGTDGDGTNLSTATLSFNHICDPGFVNDPRAAGLQDDDYHLTGAGCARDNGNVDNADAADPDGSPNDPGVYGGPDAVYTTDVDDDEVPDDWESAHGLSTNSQDPPAGEADADDDSLSDADEYESGTDPNAWDSDADGLSDGLETADGTDPLSACDPGPHDEAPGTLWVPEDFDSIQEAIDAAHQECIIQVAAGTYGENLQAAWKNVSLEGAGASSTRIEGDGTDSVLVVDSAERFEMAGFTIRGGAADDGGGVSITQVTESALSQCILEANTAEYGGGLELLDGTHTLSHVVIDSCSASQYGAGIYTNVSQLSATHLQLLRNESVGYGGGGYLKVQDNSSLAHSVIAFNEVAGSNSSGGGLYLYSGKLAVANTIFFQNAAGNSSSTNIYCTNNSCTSSFNDYYDVSGAKGASGVSSTSDLTEPPGFVDDYSDGNATDDNYHLSTDSRLVNLGDPSLVDPDGSICDIGVYGGAGADDWDLDGDGLYDWFWPGEIDDAPDVDDDGQPDFQSSDYDCDDLDPAIQSCL